jgi:hypothetical protein
MRQPPSHLDALIDLLVDAALAELAAEAPEILNADGDVPPEYSAEAEPPQEDER